MKRLSTGVLAALIVTFCGLNAVAAPSNAAQGNIGNSVAQGGGPPPADFGSPPSGQIPILYNDHHVYSKPDVLKQGRVLAALVKGGTLLIPLRSMFEQMGATVSWDAGSRTATVSKPGAEVKVTVGKPEVVINGETRPLDVPPIVYQGNVLVPVRVISEGMGRTYNGFRIGISSSFDTFRQPRRRVRRHRRLRPLRHRRHHRRHRLHGR